MNITLHCGDSAEVLKQYPDNHFDSVVSDPPYGIEFLGKDWDKHTGTVDLWKEVFRVLKPGGYLLAFSAARTYHRLATNIESVGFEIKDQLMWIYSSGFPKSQDIGKMIDKQGDNGSEWNGYKTALKPAHEPIVMARKPTKLSFAANVQKYGTGALNIDATRIPFESDADADFYADGKERYTGWGMADDGAPVFQGTEKKKKSDRPTINVLKQWSAMPGENSTYTQEYDSVEANSLGRYPSNVLGEIEGYQKYFYCPKVGRKERHLGFSNIPAFDKPEGDVNGSNRVQVLRKRDPQEFLGNNHPTVKPINLMAYLVRLVTPKGGLVLDPFNGSGSTGLACVKEGMNYVGIDLNQKYIDISNTRIEAYKKELEAGELPKDLFGE